MAHTLYDITIRVQWGENNYGDDGSDATGSITLSSVHLPDAITIKYSGEYFASELLPQMLKDIAAYVKDPDEWYKDYIEKGPDTWKKLHRLEQQITDYQQTIKDQEAGIEEAKRYLRSLEGEKAHLQARLNKQPPL